MSPTRLLLAATAVTALAAAPYFALAQTPAPAAAPAAAPTAPPATATPGATMAKPVVANGDTLQTLKLDPQFSTFVKAVDATNLGAVLKTPGLTVFAPIDAAFAAMPQADLTKLMADKAALQKFVMHHLVNAPVPSSKIKGTKGQWPAGSGDTKILLDGSDETALKADGATIVQADVKTGSGTLHVVDKVLIAGQGDPSMPQAAAAPAAD
ncbi:fasciclin domain-containing protein [uncultured Phenylobacterium sp.]|uniref:fasciclin domain-containing protein n=1 Tax=uncultured Phenylobacterium sp. TaxID=349273 RepID=UPI0025FB3FB1|nr:fasciclin domain-containing protein [uncultured Phenylobacterium sp.]